jgi:hypothetical protein
MKGIYSLLHFANKTPKHLLISIPDTVPDVDKEERVIISISSEDTSQSFALSSAGISDFIVALSYACDMLQWRRIAAINVKYFTKEVKK